MLGDNESEIELAERAVALNANLYFGWQNRGCGLQIAGLHEEALRSFECAMRLRGHTQEGGRVAKPIVLQNGRSWTSQKAALTHFNEMLAQYDDEDPVDQLTDHDDLVALLERYDAAISGGPSKIGPGIDSFFRRRNTFEGYSTPGVLGSPAGARHSRCCVRTRRDLSAFENARRR